MEASGVGGLGQRPEQAETGRFRWPGPAAEDQEGPGAGVAAGADGGQVEAQEAEATA